MRKKVALGEAVEVRRIRSVDGADAVARFNAHRVGLNDGDWSTLLRERAAFIAKPRPVAAQPAVLRPLKLPIFVTRYLASVRHWPRLKELLDSINQLFSPVQIHFELTEPAECNRSVGLRGLCPFADDLDHEYEWLHLALVTRLTGDQPVAPSCGRCCLVPDRSEPLDVAKVLAAQLGVPDAHFGADGIELSSDQVQWMRWQAWLILGQLVPLPRLAVPLHVFSTPTSQRSEADFCQLLERVNRIWQQAAVEFVMVRWTPTESEETQPDDPLASVVVCLGSDSELTLSDKPTRLLLPDGGGVDELALARGLGKLLGLADVPGADQLMFSATRGNRLSIPEIVRARSHCQLLTFDQTPHQVRLASLQRSFPRSVSGQQPVRVSITLLRGSRLAARQTLEQAAEWVERVCCILTQTSHDLQVELHEAFIDDASMQAALPNPPGPPSGSPPRKASAAALLKLPGYRSDRLNIMVVHELPQVGKNAGHSAYTAWPGSRVMLLAEQFPGHSLDKQLAQALVVYWGLKASPKAGMSSLLGWRTGGLRLAEDEQSGLQTTGASPTPAPSQATLSLIKIPVQLLYPADLGEIGARARLDMANRAQSRHGLRWEVQSCQLAPAEPDPNCLTLEIHSGTRSELSREERRLLAGTDVDAALTTFLNRNTTAGLRTQAQYLLEALDPGTAGEPGNPLQLPVRILQVSNPGLASLAIPAEIQPLGCAGVELRWRGYQSTSVSPVNWKAALPNASGDRVRQPNFAALLGTPGYDMGALNLFLVSKLTSEDGQQQFRSIQDRGRKILIVRDHDEKLPLEQLIVRALLTFFEIPPHDFAGANSLRGDSGGEQLTPREIDKVRADVARLFPSLFQLPRFPGS